MRFPSRLGLPSEAPGGAAASWTEERGTSDEGRRRVESALAASGKHGLTEGLGWPYREACCFPGLEAAVQVSGLVQANPPQRGGRQRGRIALRAHDDDLHV